MARKLSGWHAENIKAELRKKHGTLRVCAGLMGITPQSLSDVFTDPCGSARVERLIAADLGVALHVLWPDRWTPTGQKIDRSEYRRQRRLAKAVA
jgi:Ner family transcriptional regulator